MRRIQTIIAFLVFSAMLLAQQAPTPKAFDSIADALASNPASYTIGGRGVIEVLGHDAPGDWGGTRLFRVERSVLSGSDTNRAHRFNFDDGTFSMTSLDRYSPRQDVRWWGGFPDDSLDDSAAIQNWHDKQEGRVDKSDGWTNAIGGVLVLPPGNFVFTNKVTITNLVEIAGAGRGLTVINVTGSNNGFYNHIPWFSGPYAWSKLKGFTLEKDLSLQSGIGIVQEWNGSMIIINDVGVQGFYDGIELKGWVSHLQGVTSRQNGRHGVSVPDTVPAGINPTHIRFEMVESQSNGGNGFDIQNSSYLHFTSCVSEWHTNGIGWHIASTPTRTVYASHNGTTFINCSSEMDHEAAVFENVANVAWYGGFMLPRVPGQGNESTNIVRFVGPCQVQLNNISTEMAYTPSWGGWTVVCEDLGYGWPHNVEINGGSWRRMLLGLENRPGTVRWNRQWTVPTSFPILQPQPTGFTNLGYGSIGFDLSTTTNEVGTNEFSLLLDITVPDYAPSSSEVFAHLVKSTSWDNDGAFYLTLNADSKFEISSYNPDVNNRVTWKGTNSLFGFSGQRVKMLVSRSRTEGPSMWIGGKRIKLQEYQVGSGGDIGTNNAPGPYLHFGNRLGFNRFLYHGGAMLNFAVTNDGDALGICDKGPLVMYPWAAMRSGTNGVVLAWEIGQDGEFRDASPHMIPAHQFGAIRMFGTYGDLWRTYGTDWIKFTNSTQSSIVRQNSGAANGTLLIENPWGGITVADTTNAWENKTVRIGAMNFGGKTYRPLGMIGALTYTNGGDVYFGGYNTELAVKPSAYYWGYGADHLDYTGWLGMRATRGGGLHLVDPPTLQIGSDEATETTNRLVIAHTDAGVSQVVTPGTLDIYAQYPISEKRTAQFSDSFIYLNQPTRANVLYVGTNAVPGSNVVINFIESTPVAQFVSPGRIDFYANYPIGARRTVQMTDSMISLDTNTVAPLLMVGTNKSGTSGNLLLTHSLASGRSQIVSPERIDIYSGYPSYVASRVAYFTYGGFAVDSGMAITLGGVSRTYWPGSVIGGSLVSEPNFSDSGDIEWTLYLSTNAIATLKTNGVTAGTYIFPELTVDSKGRVSSISSGDAASDSKLYGRYNGVWTAVDTNHVAGLQTQLASKSDLSHVHDAADVSSGTFIAERLGTGTPTTNTFLQGQGTGTAPAWTTIPSTPSPTNGIADAPADGNMYARLNNAWSALDISYVYGLSTFGREWIDGTVASESDARAALQLTGGSAATIDSPAQLQFRLNSGVTSYTRHRLNVIEGTGIDLTLADDSGSDEVDLTVAWADGDRGDFTVTSGNAVLDSGVVTYGKMQNIGAQSRLIGRGSASGPTPEEISIGDGLEMDGTTLKATTPTSAGVFGWVEFVVDIKDELIVSSSAHGGVASVSLSTPPAYGDAIILDIEFTSPRSDTSYYLTGESSTFVSGDAMIWGGVSAPSGVTSKTVNGVSCWFQAGNGSPLLWGTGSGSREVILSVMVMER